MNSNSSIFEMEKKIRKIIYILARRVSLNLSKVESNGLFFGLSGQLLFLYKVNGIKPSCVSEMDFQVALNKIQNQLESHSLDLNGGLSGQAWMLEYLQQNEIYNYDPDLLSDVDLLFNNVLNADLYEGELEIVLGLAGYMPYISRRAKFTEQTTLLNTILSCMEKNATIVNEDYLTWKQPFKSVYRVSKEKNYQPEYNLGFAHGVPGIIASLLTVYRHPKLADRARKLIEGGCNWLLGQRNPDKLGECCYGCHAGGPYYSRLGWCYGDLTIALTLARVGNALGISSYTVAAKEIAINASKRDSKSGVINDAGLCHGYFGIAMIYQILEKIIPDPVFSDAKQHWLNVGLTEFSKEGIRAFYRYNGISKDYEEDFSLLMGYAGIGLALISLLDNNVDWADCLLIA